MLVAQVIDHHCWMCCKTQDLLSRDSTLQLVVWLYRHPRKPSLFNILTPKGYLLLGQETRCVLKMM